MARIDYLVVCYEMLAKLFTVPRQYLKGAFHHIITSDIYGRVGSFREAVEDSIHLKWLGVLCGSRSRDLPGLWAERSYRA